MNTARARLLHGEYARTTAQRVFLTIGHAVVVAVVVWLLSGGVLTFREHLGDPLRRAVLAACSVVYFCRLIPTTFVFMRRSVQWSEVLVVLLWISVIHLTFAYTGGANRRGFDFLDGIAICLYVAGSLLNTASEYSRMKWKEKHPGELYTSGFFGWSRHINYFGDSVLFTGFALLTGTPWTLVLPLVMTLSFLFAHIPGLESHLAQKYGRDFDLYKRRTRKFVPFLY